MRPITDNDEILQWLNDRKRKLIAGDEMPHEIIYATKMRYEGWKIANIQFYDEHESALTSTDPDERKTDAEIILTSGDRIWWSRGEDSEIEKVFI